MGHRLTQMKRKRGGGGAASCLSSVFLCAPSVAGILRFALAARAADEGWALRAPVRPEPPAVRSGGSRNAIDAFVLSRLEREKLPPSPEADRRTLIRRVSFDLTGLPPMPED